MDRWISMATYTGNIQDYKSSLAQGIKASGSAFGVGLCPVCQVLGKNDVEMRFSELAKYSGQVRELDMWASSNTVGSNSWQYYWPQLEKWLATSDEQGILV